MGLRDNANGKVQCVTFVFVKLFEFFVRKFYGAFKSHARKATTTTADEKIVDARWLAVERCCFKQREFFGTEGAGISRGVHKRDEAGRIKSPPR